MPISKSELRLGESVAILGHPDLHARSGFSAIPAHVINTDPTGYATDFLMLGFSTEGGSGGPIVNGKGQVIGMSVGWFAVDWDDEEDSWIYLKYLATGIDVAKHLR